MNNVRISIAARARAMGVVAALVLLHPKFGLKKAVFE